MQVRSKHPFVHVLVAVAAGIAAYMFADASESVRIILGLLAFSVFSIQGDVLNIRKTIEERL